MLGFEIGGVRLPLVEVDDAELAELRRMLERCGPRRGEGLTLASTLRVLPLGGLGEIGKNMTVVEYDGRIVVVDTGLMFPTPEMLGIDLVLPDFTYLRDHADRHRGDRPHARPRGPRRRPALGAARAGRVARRSTAAR